MKIGIVCTTHFSKKNNMYGHIEVKKFLDSLQYIDYEFNLYLVDNQSEEKLNTKYENENWYNYYYIEDQSKFGLSGAWNFGVKKAIENNNDLIINCNDDLIFDNSINNWIKSIMNHEFKDVGFYGPLTNVGGSSTQHQIITDKGLYEKFTETTKYYALNGFINAFTKECYNNYVINNNFYSINKEHKWGGQEIELFERNTPLGMRSFIYHNCFIKHVKHRSWLSAKNNEKK